MTDGQKRSAPRHRVLKSGTISFGRAAGFDCIVRNVSETGAMLEIASPIGIPDGFVLAISKDNLQRNCNVVWRSARRIGVEFC
jgi:hypothetical protein